MSNPQAEFDIDDDLLTKLREAVVLRRIESGIEWFQTHRDAILSLNPGQRNAAAFVGEQSGVDRLFDETHVGIAGSKPAH